MVQPPCKKSGVDCNKRQPGCHSKCPEYKAFVLAREHERAQIAEQRKRDDEAHLKLMHERRRRK